MSISNESATTSGWIIFVAAVGLMCGMLAVDVVSLKEWSAMQTPVFVGTTLGHISAVVAAFVGGKLIPEAREGMQTRAADPPQEKNP